MCSGNEECKNKKCPAGKIECNNYDYLDSESRQRDSHPSAHRCWAFKESHYIEKFELCPWPSRQRKI